MKRILQYTLKGLAVFAGVLIVVYTAAYIYVAANKRSIISQIKQQVAEKLNGEVQIGDIDLSFLASFPGISVTLENVSIKDTLYAEHKHPFFQAQKVFADISVINVIQKNNPLIGIKVEQGQLYIYTDTAGYTNSYLLSPKAKPGKVKKDSTSKTGIEEIKLRGVRLVLNDLKKRKLYDFEVTKFNCKIKTEDSAIRFKTKNDILIHSLAFNTAKGSYVREAPLEGNFKIYYNKNRKQLTFDDIDIDLKNHPFTLSGAFNFTETPTFQLKVTTKKIAYSLAKSLLTEKIASALSLANLEKPIDDVTAEISGPLKGGEPLVNVQWKVSKNNVQSPSAGFTDCSFTGSYTNELIPGLPRKDPNSRLQFHDFKGDWESLRIVSQNIYIDNLVTPMINCDIKTDFSFEQLNNVLESNTLDFQKGTGTLDITYSGPLHENSNKNTLINGKFTFSDGLMTYAPRNIQMKDVNGSIVFKNTDVFVNDLRTNVQGSKIVMNGAGKNLLAAMKTNPGKAFLDWNIYSPSLDLGNFTSLLQQRKTTVRRKSKSKLGSTARNIDEVAQQANFRVDVKTDELIYKRFEASNVNASLGLANENWTINNVSFQHGGGSMTLSGMLTEKNKKYYGAGLKVKVQNVDVNKVMYAFNNFGQDGISYENLRGKLSATVDVRMDIDRDLEGTPTNMDGFVDFSLKKGALLKYEPLMKIQNVVFKNRNFGEIYFAELKDRLDIKGKEITINRMEIQSTVLTLYVEGVYSLQGKTDISIQVPLSNIKKREENYKPKNKGANSKGGMSVFVRGTPGDDGKIQFKLDLFRKFRKTNKPDPDHRVSKETTFVD